MSTNKNVEYISSDIFDEEFLDTFRFRHNFQILIASSRVDIKDRFVTPPSVFQRGCTILHILIVLILDYIIIHRYHLLLSKNTTLYCLSASVTGLQTLIFLSNILHVRFLNGNLNAEFYVQLQNVNKLMKLNRNKTITSMIRRKSLFSITIVLVICAALLCVVSFKGTVSFWSFVGLINLQISFMTELSTCGNMFTFLFIHTNYMNCIIQNYTEQTKWLYSLTRRQKIISKLIITKRAIRQMAAETHSFTSSPTDEYLKEILRAFSMFQSAYSFQVFLSCCKLVASSLITFEFILFAVRNDNIAFLDSLIQAIFTIVDLLIVVMLGIRCEFLIREIKKTKRLAITILHLHCEGRLRDKAKRMLKLIEETPPHFMVYDMWQLDAHILLQMFMFVTSLIVTQLQFVFL